MGTGILAVRSFVPLLIVACIAGLAHSQETVFNVPSPDMLARGSVYLETDHYFRIDATENASDGFFYLRGVVGAGRDIEVGVNAGGFEYQNESSPYADLAVKWRPVQRTFTRGDAEGAWGLFLGDHVGFALRDVAPDEVRNYAYAAGYLVAPRTKTRISGGPYYATSSVFTADDEAGVQLTLEQPLARLRGLTLAVDWFFSDGAYATPGVLWTLGRCIVYAAYGIANDADVDNTITLEFGLSL